MKQRQSKLCCCKLQPFLPTNPSPPRAANLQPARQRCSSEPGPHRMTDAATQHSRCVKTVLPYWWKRNFPLARKQSEPPDKVAHHWQSREGGSSPRTPLKPSQPRARGGTVNTLENTKLGQIQETSRLSMKLKSLSHWTKHLSICLNIYLSV